MLIFMCRLVIQLRAGLDYGDGKNSRGMKQHDTTLRNGFFRNIIESHNSVLRDGRCSTGIFSRSD